MLTKIFPFIEWFKGYNLTKLRADFIAGLTVALVLIPQSMAYAQLAGLPAYYGLYASFLPPMIASLFGSSRQLATGPVAVVSLMTAATLEPLATAGGEAFIAYAIFLALLVGLFQLSLGVLRLGVIVNFLSHPVVIGFTNAAAIIIATSQLSKMFGVSVDKAEHHYETIWRVLVAAVNFTHWPTLFLGVMAFAIMIGLKKINPRIPFVLAAVLVTTIISWAIGLEQNTKINLNQIDDAATRQLVEAFNHDIHDVELMSETRSLLGPEVEETLGKGNAGLCIRCHSQHDVSLDMLRKQEEVIAGAKDVHPKSAMELHAMAGLLDRHLKQLKASASEKRSKLREMKFAAIGEGEAMRFVVNDGSRDGDVWRMKVGNVPLKLDGITMKGGGDVVGTVPEGLPKISAPKWDASVFGKLFVAAIIISILGFMEAISIAKAMAARTGQRLDPNQELIGQGVANILGSCTQSYAVSGSFSRSAVNIQGGALTGMSSVFTSALVVIVLLFFTPLLYHLPQSVLAAVIMMAVIGLINFKGIVHAWHVKRSDGAIAVISFLFTLAFAPHLDKGILIGVILSIGVFLYGKMKPGIAELSLWTDGHLHNAKRFGLKQCKHIVVIRFDGPLFFANTSYLEDEVLNRVREMPELKHLLFVANGVNDIDASGEEALSLLVERLRSGNYEVSFAGFNERILDTLHRSHLYEKIGGENLYPTPHTALERIWEKAHKDSDETDCPLRKVVPTDAAPDTEHPQVLIVDDEKDFADTLAKRLRRRGFEVTTAYDGKAAIEQVRTKPFGVALVDIHLPGMDGVNVMVDIHELDPKLPVILLTGYGTVDEAVEGMTHGAKDLIQKPCDIDELQKKINMAVHES